MNIVNIYNEFRFSSTYFNRENAPRHAPGIPNEYADSGLLNHTRLLHM